ncbi:MAG: PIN domain-containing protein [Thermodesulfobacteriota bacterium]
MKSFLIDTNCLISFITTRDIEQNEVITGFFEDAAGLNSEILIISNVISEFVYTLQSVYKVDLKKISEIINDLLNNPGIKYHNGYYPLEVIKLWPTKIKDYGDAVIASAAIELNATVLTFDKNFSNQLKKTVISYKLLP